MFLLTRIHPKLSFNLSHTRANRARFADARIPRQLIPSIQRVSRNIVRYEATKQTEEHLRARTPAANW